MIAETLLATLTSWIIENTEFDKKLDYPELHILSKSEMSRKACFSSSKCRGKSLLCKRRRNIFYRHLKPESEICDRSIILHELIHHYQKQNKTFDLDEHTL